jgi:hypothetical protein
MSTQQVKVQKAKSTHERKPRFAPVHSEANSQTLLKEYSFGFKVFAVILILTLVLDSSVSFVHSMDGQSIGESEMQATPTTDSTHNQEIKREKEGEITSTDLDFLMSQEAPTTPLPEVRLAEFEHDSEVTVTPTSKDTFVITYTSDSVDSFGGGVFLYDTPIDLNNLFGATGKLALKLSSAEISEIGFEIKDVLGNMYQASLIDIINTLQVYEIHLNEITGIDLTQVSEIVFVLSGNKTGNVVIEWGRFDYIPQITPAIDQGTSVSALPEVSLAEFERNAEVTVTPTSKDTFVISYTSDSADSFGGSIFDYDTPLNLTDLFGATGKLVFKLSSAELNEISFELKDVFGGTYQANLTDVTSTPQVYEILLSDITGIDLTQASKIVYTLSGNKAGSVAIKWDAYLFGFLLPSENQEMEVTALPEVTVHGFESSEAVNQEEVKTATSNVTVTSKNRFTLEYTGMGVNAYGGVAFFYEDFATEEETESINLRTLFPEGKLAFKLAGAGLNETRIEFKDATNQVFSLELKGLTEDLQFYEIEFRHMRGIDITQIKEIVFVSRGAGSGTLEVEWGTFSFRSEVTPHPSFTPLAMPALPGFPSITLLKPNKENESTVIFSAGQRGAKLTYNTEQGGFSGTGFTYDDFNTQNIETFDLSTLDELVFGLISDEERIKVEVIDKEGNKANAPLIGINPFLEQVWVVPTDLFTGVDLTQVRLIYFIVEGENKVGTLTVNKFPGEPMTSEEEVGSEDLPITEDDDIHQQDETIPSEVPDGTVTTITDDLGLLLTEVRDDDGRLLYLKERSGKENVALGKKVSSSPSYYGNAFSAVDAQYGEDPVSINSGGHAWQGSNNTDLETWIELDLGSQEDVHEIVVSTEGPLNLVGRLHATAYDLYVSEDGASWEFVDSEVDLSHGQLITYQFPKKHIQYVRIENIKGAWHNGRDARAVIGEVWVHGHKYRQEWVEYENLNDQEGNLTGMRMTVHDDLGLLRIEERDTEGELLYLKERSGKENVAIGKSVNGSSGFPPSVVSISDEAPSVDPEPLYRSWEGDLGEENGWLEVDLGSEENVHEIILANGTRFDSLDVFRNYDGRHATSFDLYVSKDGVTWELVSEERDLTEGRLITYQFPEKSIRYVRLENIDGNFSDGSFVGPAMGAMWIHSYQYDELNEFNS